MTTRTYPSAMITSGVLLGVMAVSVVIGAYALMTSVPQTAPTKHVQVPGNADLLSEIAPLISMAVFGIASMLK